MKTGFRGAPPGGKGIDIPIVMDSGCTKGTISEDSVQELGLRVTELEHPLSIMSVTCEVLNIVGTSVLYIKTQVTCPGRKMIEAAVLKGNHAEKELLVSFKNLKKFYMINRTFAYQTVDEYYVYDIHNDYPHCKPVSLILDERLVEQVQATNDTKPFDVPYHLRRAYEREISYAIDAGILVPWDTLTK